MFIDTSTAVTIIISVITSMFSAFLTVHLSDNPNSKRRCYIVIISVTALLIFAPLLLRYWSLITEKIPVIIQSSRAYVVSAMSMAGMGVTDFTRSMGRYLLLFFGILPWGWIFVRIIIAEKEYQVLTGIGLLFFFLCFPAFVIKAEVFVASRLFLCLCAAGRTNHILWIMFVSLLLQTIITRFILKRFLALCDD